jgi:hypothetical protein
MTRLKQCLLNLRFEDCSCDRLSLHHHHLAGRSASVDMAGRRKSTVPRTSTPNGVVKDDVDDPYSSSFDPASFKVVQLRALLSEHEVAFPSTARKADLIRVYEEEIRPNIDELRAARNRDLNIRPRAENGTADSSMNGHAHSTSGSEKDGESSGAESESQMPPSALSRPGQVMSVGQKTKSQKQMHPLFRSIIRFRVQD